MDFGLEERGESGNMELEKRRFSRLSDTVKKNQLTFAMSNPKVSPPTGFRAYFSSGFSTNDISSVLMVDDSCDSFMRTLSHPTRLTSSTRIGV